MESYEELARDIYFKMLDKCASWSSIDGEGDVAKHCDKLLDWSIEAAKKIMVNNPDNK